MVRVKTTPKKTVVLPRYKRKYILKERLDMPKTVKFGNKQFVVRYKRISKKTKL